MTTSAATGGAGAAAAQEPVDDRPIRPAWTPAFTATLGAPGWMQSTAPICESIQGLGAAFDVWADERGVFAMFADSCNIFAGVSCEKTGASLKYNSGSGWQLVYQFAPGTIEPGFKLLWGGLPEGPMVVTGVVDGKDGVHFVDKGGVKSQADTKGANVAFVVGNDLAYASDGTNILSYAAGAWSKVGQSANKLLGLWADKQTVIAVGEDQTVLVKSGNGALAPMAGVPAGTYTSVWAFSATDVWLGNTSAQLLHYDGAAWKVIATGSRDISGAGIRQLWGAAGTVYFITSTEMGRWNGSGVEMLLQPAQGVDTSALSNQFGSIWGRSANEVFVAMRDRKFADFACGSVFMLWFDGTQFHQF